MIRVYLPRLLLRLPDARLERFHLIQSISKADLQDFGFVKYFLNILNVHVLLLCQNFLQQQVYVQLVLLQFSQKRVIQQLWVASGLGKDLWGDNIHISQLSAKYPAQV